MKHSEDLFDPSNVEHMKHLLEYLTTGIWPECDYVDRAKNMEWGPGGLTKTFNKIDDYFFNTYGYAYGKRSIKRIKEMISLLNDNPKPNLSSS